MRFKTTTNIFKDSGEYFDPNWMDSDKVILPPKIDWDYSRELKIEDVDIWEVVYEQGGGVGIYAAWMPYAEFYIVRAGWQLESKGHGVETYYGQGAQDAVIKRAKDLGISISTKKAWVDSKDMWLYK
jgi:hypothetical protein